MTDEITPTPTPTPAAKQPKPKRKYDKNKNLIPEHGYKSRALQPRKIAKLLQLQLQHPEMTISEKARVAKVSGPSVVRILNEFKDIFKDINNVDNYTTCRNSILNSAELTLLRTLLQEDKLSEARLGELAKGFGVVHNARRLEQGLSTSNASVFTTVRSADYDKSK
jgi:hypothetical protein